MSQLFEQLLSAVIDSGDARSLTMHPEIRTFASLSTLDATLYEIVDGHLQKYGKVPSLHVVEEQFGKPLPKAHEPPRFYLDQIRPLHIRKVLTAAVTDAQSHFALDPAKSLSVLEAAIHGLRGETEALSMIDFREASSRIMRNLAIKLTGEGFYGFGWPALDDQSSGMTAGDLISIVGFSGVGKTLVMLDRAFFQWKHNKRSVLFISMEMSLDAILERMAAIHSSTPANYLKNAMFPNVFGKDYKKQMVKQLKDAAKAPVPFYVIDGNLAVRKEDIHRLCAQLAPQSLWVDGAYLLGGTSYQNRWQTIAESGTYLKQIIATRMGIPTIASYQFNRDAMRDMKKGKDGKAPSRPDLSGIAGSAEIGNLSTISLSVQVDDTPDASGRRRIDVMKGRNGETGHFFINWDWQKMIFDQDGVESEDYTEIS